MTSRAITGALAALLLAAPQAALAECLGPNCFSGLEALIGSVIVYGLLGIILLILLVMRKGRIAGVFAAVLFAAAVCVPLASQAWQAWKVFAMERREVVGTPPPLSSVTPLLVASKKQCYFGACEAILRAVGPKGIVVLPLDVLEGLDLSAPMDLASLPLQNWAAPREQGGSIDTRRLSPTMAAQMAPKIDYLIYVQSTFYASTQGPVDLALAKNPALAGLGRAEVGRFAMARMPSGTGTLSLQSLQFDLLDLWMGDQPLGLPLAPLNRLSANNTNPTAKAAAQAICPISYGELDYDCVEGLQ